MSAELGPFDGPIRANRFTESRDLNPACRFQIEASRTNRADAMK